MSRKVIDIEKSDLEKPARESFEMAKVNLTLNFLLHLFKKKCITCVRLEEIVPPITYFKVIAVYFTEVRGAHT